MVTVTIKQMTMSGREVDYTIDFDALVAGMDDEIREDIHRNCRRFRMCSCPFAMDDEIREDIHSNLAPCTEQEFADEYMRRHEAKFGELLAVI